MKPKQVGVFEAKTRLSELLSKVKQGQVYLISRRGHPIAELRPVAQEGRLSFGVHQLRARLRQPDADADAVVPGTASGLRWVAAGGGF
jgi:prevent-host-death family protein